MSITETCCCGSVLTLTGESHNVEYRQRAWHDAHASCRGQQVPPCELCGRPRNTHEHIGREWDEWRADVIRRARSIQ